MDREQQGTALPSRGLALLGDKPVCMAMADHSLHMGQNQVLTLHTCFLGVFSNLTLFTDRGSQGRT